MLAAIHRAWKATTQEWNVSVCQHSKEPTPKAKATGCGRTHPQSGPSHQIMLAAIQKAWKASTHPWNVREADVLYMRFRFLSDLMLLQYSMCGSDYYQRIWTGHHLCCDMCGSMVVCCIYSNFLCVWQAWTSCEPCVVAHLAKTSISWRSQPKRQCAILVCSQISCVFCYE